MEHREVRNDERKTAYGCAGSDADRTLLFVHGSGADSRLWKNQFDTLSSEGYRVVAPDLSGHRGSDDLPPDTEPGYETLDAYARDVATVARETDASVLVGNSLGGAVVLRAVLEDLFAPDALALAGTGAKLGVRDGILDALRGEFENAVAVSNEASFHDPPDDAVELSECLLRENGQDVLVRDFETCDAFDERSRVDEIDAPTLALVGSDDSLTPVWFHEFLADRIPDCELHVVEDAGHLAMLERPEEFDDALTDFLRRI